MRTLHAGIVIFAAAYAGCLALYHAAVGAAPESASIAWYVWRGVGAACLSSTAVELTVLMIWLWKRCTRGSSSGGVPLHLTAADRRLLDQTQPALALLMPAHNEASTPEDREALVDRIYEILLRTPAYSTFFLLADSPANQRENEMSVIRHIKSRLRAEGLSEHENRVVLEEYRDKPAAWRHKCGSILRWIERWGDEYEFMFMLDADSSLARPDPSQPATCDVVERMLVGALRDTNLAIIQAAIQIRQTTTLWGWIQAVNTRMAMSYYLPAYGFLYGRSAPCYGHNCLLRVRDFARHATNTLSYTSHDHVDSADLASAGRGCVLSDTVLTCEQTEETLPGWLKRECRWSRGNGQWISYLWKKRCVSLGAVVYMGLGILQYIWALLASIFFISAIVLMHRDVRLVANADGVAARVLAGLVVITLVVPKLIASPTLPQFLATLFCSLLLGPALTLYQGVCFLLGAFGTKWVPRGARSGAFDAEQITRISATFLPAAILGIVLWQLLTKSLHTHLGDLLLYCMTVALVISPVAAVIFSWPRPSPALERSSHV